MSLRSYIAPLAALLAPGIASAHEVYVLTPAEIQSGLATASFNEVSVASHDLSAFAFWGFVAALTIFVVFFASISRALERHIDPLYARLRRYAAPIARITVGISFIAAAYYQASYGPELPLVGTFGSYAWLATIVLVIMGLLLIVDRYVRSASLVALGFFAIATWYHGIYMLTYTSYIGEVVVLLGVVAAEYRFAVLRVCFGISLLYASIYAKIMHNDLALQVASLPLAGHAHSIAAALGFEPHFLVLGAAIIEIVIATFFILGIEIRFTSFFLLFWLSLSLWWFGEVVWPHIILIGIPLAFICYGYDRYSLEGFFFKKGAREPVL